MPSLIHLIALNLNLNLDRCLCSHCGFCSQWLVIVVIVVIVAILVIVVIVAILFIVVIVVIVVINSLMLLRLWFLVGSDRQCQLLSCPGQLKKIWTSKEQDFLSPSGSSVFDFGVPFSWGIVQSPLPCPVPFVYATIVFKWVDKWKMPS